MVAALFSWIDRDIMVLSSKAHPNAISYVGVLSLSISNSAPVQFYTLSKPTQAHRNVSFRPGPAIADPAFALWCW